MSLSSFAERRLTVARSLHEGAHGASYIDACLLVSALLSGVASLLWPSMKGDRRRFVEVWATLADPGLRASRISTPLLVRHLRDAGLQTEVAALQGLCPVAYGPGEDTRVVTGEEVDLDEADVRKACPTLSTKDIRRFSYPVLFYEQVRSAIVHEYELGASADAVPMSSRAVSVSYTNVLVDRHSPFGIHKRIHFHFPWLTEVARSIAKSSEQHVPSAPLPNPTTWWIEGR